MKKKWQIVFSVILYIFIVACALDFNIFLLFDLRLIVLTLVGTLLLTLPYYEKGISRRELLYIFGRKSIDTGFIQTFLLLFARLQNEAEYNRLLSDIALCFRPLLYGFCLFILLAERIEAHDTENVDGSRQPAVQIDPIKSDTLQPDVQTSEKQENISFKSFTQTDIHEFAMTYALTRRETEITQLIIQGKSNAMIAGELFISETTVKKHVSNIFDKTGVSRREELIVQVRGNQTI